MFRSKKKQAQQASETAVQTDGDSGTTEMPAVEAVPAEPVAEAPPIEAAPDPQAGAPAAEEPAPQPEPVAAAGNGAQGNGAPESGAQGNGGRPSRSLKLNDLMSEPPRKSEEQRQQEAAAELMAAIAPSQQMLMEEVPDAASPDAAANQLMDRQNERPVLPDPEGQSLSASDIYWTDSSVYYRVRKHFKWGPQRGPYNKGWTSPAGLSEPTRNTARGRLPAP